MSIQLQNPQPAFNIVRSSHVVLGVTDLERSRAYYVDALGLIETERVADTLYLRALEERNHHSLVLVQSDEVTCHRLGFKVASEDDLDRAAAFFRQQQLPTEWVERHAQGRTLHVSDPFRVPLEFYYTMEQRPCFLQRYGEYRGAHIQRIDHFNCFAAEVQSAYDFYADKLGFRLTEYTVTEDDPEQLWAVWMHRKGNVHDLALTNGYGPRLHHFAYWVAGVMNIIHLCDVLATTGWLKSMERGPGRHGISNAFFLYLRDPDGHRIELFTSDYLTVDPDWQPIRWALSDATRQTLWGHPAPRSWFEEGTSFHNVEIGAPILKAQPIVAH
jgi:catechol 2,3-dioxygenase